MELSEMEKRLLYQIEGSTQYAVLNELHMTVRYATDPTRKETAEGLMRKPRPLSDDESVPIVGVADITGMPNR